MEITDVKVIPVDDEKLKAFVSIVFDQCFVVTDIKIIHGSHAQATPRPHFDDTLCHERAHGLPHDGARDAELLTELTLGGQAVADVETIRQDRLEHHVGHLVREPPLSIHKPEERRFRAPEAGLTSVVSLDHAHDHTSYRMPPHLLDGRHAVV